MRWATFFIRREIHIYKKKASVQQCIGAFFDEKKKIIGLVFVSETKKHYLCLENITNN